MKILTIDNDSYHGMAVPESQFDVRLLRQTLERAVRDMSSATLLCSRSQDEPENGWFRWYASKPTNDVNEILSMPQETGRIAVFESYGGDVLVGWEIVDQSNYAPHAPYFKWQFE